MAKDTLSRQIWWFFAVIYNFFFVPTESQVIKQVMKNVVILMQNQNLPQLFIDVNVQATNITKIYLPKTIIWSMD